MVPCRGSIVARSGGSDSSCSGPAAAHLFGGGLSRSGTVAAGICAACGAAGCARRRRHCRGADARGARLRRAAASCPIPAAAAAARAAAADLDIDDRIAGRWSTIRVAIEDCEHASCREEELVEAGLDMCDLLYERYVSRHGPIPEGDPVQRMELLRALRAGNVKWLKKALSTAEEGSWDFVYPPAQRLPDGSRDPSTEGFCRSPLSMLARPDVGFLGRCEVLCYQPGQALLPGISTRRRLELIRRVLASGVASPRFMRGYWANPATMAALGDKVGTLAALHEAGLDLRTVGVEWLLHTSMTFTLAHAAAYNGSIKVLQYMRETYFDPTAKPEELATYFDRPDCMGATALDLAMSVSRSEATAETLLDLGCDAFRRDPLTQSSVLSLSLERNLPLAEKILASRSGKKQMWFGNSLVRTDYSGLVLPASRSTGLQFRSQQNDEELSLEELIAASTNKNLAGAEIIKSLIDVKWQGFAGEQYLRSLQEYVVLFVLVAAIAVGGFTERAAFLLPFQTPLLLASAVAWGLFVRKQASEISANGSQSYFREASKFIDVGIMVYLPTAIAGHLSSIWSHEALTPAIVGMDAVSQIFMSWRLLFYLSAFEPSSFGPFLLVVTSLLSAVLEPLGFIVLVLLTFANAFTIVLNYGSGQEPRPYLDVLAKEARIVLKGAQDFDESSSLFRGLPLEPLGDVLLLVFAAVVVLGSVGLFQSTVDRTVKTASQDPDQQFQLLRLSLVKRIEREMQGDLDGGQAILERFYQELGRQEGRARISGGQPPQLLRAAAAGEGGPPVVCKRAVAAKVEGLEGGRAPDESRPGLL